MSAIRPDRTAPKAEASSAVDATRPSSGGEIDHSLFKSRHHDADDEQIIGGSPRPR
jgi:hypothetical protein